MQGPRDHPSRVVLWRIGLINWPTGWWPGNPGITGIPWQTVATSNDGHLTAQGNPETGSTWAVFFVSREVRMDR